MLHLPVSFVKLKIKFLNLLDLYFHKEDHDLRKLTQLPTNPDHFERWMKTDWDLRGKKNPYYFVRTVKDQSKEDFWNSGYFDRDYILNNLIVAKVLGKNLDEKKVLEIGCGIGRILFPMSEKFKESTGVDISNEMIKVAKKQLTKYPNCNILVNNGTDLEDLPSNYFDFCYSFIVFQHIPDKKIIKNYIADIARVLKINSCFRFQVRGMYTIDPIKLRILDKIGTTKTNFEDTWLGVQFTSKEIHDFANAFGFEVIDESGENTEYYWITFLLKQK